MSDFAYYFIVYGNGKILRFIKTYSNIEPVLEEGEKYIRATPNEFNLLKFVKGDMLIAWDLLTQKNQDFLKMVNNNEEWAQRILEDYDTLLAENTSS